jgi:hypothetical protein
MNMTTNKTAEKLECEKCRREVIVTRPGKGQLICCGDAMQSPDEINKIPPEPVWTFEEVLTIDKEFVRDWSGRYAGDSRDSQDISQKKAELDWIFKEKERARTTLRKAGLWEREAGDVSDEAWLEYIKIIRDLSTQLNVTLRDLCKALYAYETIGIHDKRCPYCRGTGKVDASASGIKIVACPVCRGRKYNFIPESSPICKECYGTGEFISDNAIAYVRNPCPQCQGTGWTKS